MSRKIKDGTMMCIKLDNSVRNKLIELSEITGRTKTSIIEQCIRMYIDLIDRIVDEAEGADKNGKDTQRT